MPLKFADREEKIPLVRILGVGTINFFKEEAFGIQGIPAHSLRHFLRVGGADAANEDEADVALASLVVLGRSGPSETVHHLSRGESPRERLTRSRGFR